MKVLEAERTAMRKDYLSLRQLGHSKTKVRKMLSNKYDRGLTTMWDQTFDLDQPQTEVAKKTVPTGWPKTFIISGWDLRVQADDKFVACLEQMAKAYDAELILVPLQRSDARYIPEALKEKFHIVTENVQFNENLVLRYVETLALTQSPIAGHVGAYPDTTSIIPGLVKELRSEPSQKLVKQIMSTGSVGYLNADIKTYENQEEDTEFVKKWRTVTTRKYGRPTAVAQNYVVPSALIVDVLDSKIFLTRYVSSHRSGIVYDLDLKFTSTGFESSQPLALVVGDTHAAQSDEIAIQATKEMIHRLQPKETILNDWFDGISVNHHELNDAVKFQNVPSLEEEAKVTRELLEEFCELSNKIVYLNSNHDNFLLSWLNGPQTYWRLNRNYELACELQAYRLKTGKHPIERLLDFESLKNLKFITENDNHYVGKVLVKHGHTGSGGARTGFLALAKIYNYYCQGHLHQPAVFRNAVMVGLTAELDQGYNKGASAWLHANSIIQPDSSIQLLPIIAGIWSA